MNTFQFSVVGDLLEQVSRSFYRTLRILPRKVRPQISLAYLLARTTDTIADTHIVPVGLRLRALDDLSRRIQSSRPEPVDFNEFIPAQSGSAEQELLRRCEEAITALQQLDGEDRRLIRDVLQIITSGQTLDLERFADAFESRIVALKTDDELRDYTYRVAGCVGEFWTRLCRRHIFPDAALDEAALLRDGTDYGCGLQMVNILRDLPADLRQGRCYLPFMRLSELGLAPADLLDVQNEARLRPLYNELLDRTETLLTSGWRYTNRVPASAIRVRLACAWPVLIGIRTLSRLRRTQILDPAHRVKVPRAEVKKLFFLSVLCYPVPFLWRKLFHTVRAG
ncbi:MAG TPA: phytoene/squalene synthase family protein [Methylomirabilota bacterium]|nr:phytoene/squalene synthase family protein [Methylomirabilota bacterium]